jgi:uracil-DNA glycosylase
MGCVGVLGTWKRERGVVKEGKKTFFPCLQPTSRERRWYTVSSKDVV